MRYSLLLIFAALPCVAQHASLDYQRDIHPILARRCLACHASEKRSGGLSLQSYDDLLQGGRNGAAILPGKSRESLLLRRIDGEVKPVMPLGAPPLAASEIAALRDWINQGAKATPTSAAAKPRWEPPLALETPGVPASTWPEWSSPLDRFIALYLKQHAIPQPAPVSDARFARRVYLDVWGLLPTPEQLQKFLDERGADKRERLVERLLADDHAYAANWMSFWNDLLRNDEGVNYVGDRKSITAWMLAALERNAPYNEIVSSLLNPGPAGPEGFLVGVNWRGDVSASQTPFMQAAQNSAQVFLGVNLKCNSCHDSFISRWKLKDAYGLASYFSEDPNLELYRCDVKTGQFAAPHFLYPELTAEPASLSLQDRRAAAAHMFTDPRNGRVPRTFVNRVWQRLMGRAIVEPVDEMDSEPWNPALLDWLAGDFVDHGYDVKRLIATILGSRAYQMPAIARKSGMGGPAYVFRGPEVRRLSAEEFADALGEITGEWRALIPRGAKIGAYEREWRIASTPLSRALGRPIRDQVITERNNQPTTLQFLELVNGETLTHWLERAARNMLGELPPEPVSLYDSRPVGRNPDAAPVDIDISQAKRLWLLVVDEGSYAPERVLPAWANMELVSPTGVTPLEALKPVTATGLRNDSVPVEFKTTSPERAVRTTASSRLVYDIAGQGFTRIRGMAGVEKRCVQNDIMPSVRFFIFAREPNMERLIPVAPGKPAGESATLLNVDQLTDRIFRHALGRAPSNDERRMARATLTDTKHPGKPSAAGLADLLWAVIMQPEFQLIL